MALITLLLLLVSCHCPPNNGLLDDAAEWDVAAAAMVMVRVRVVWLVTCDCDVRCARQDVRHAREGMRHFFLTEVP